MKQYILKRFTYMIVIVVLMSFFSFIIIQLPPGDFLTSYIATMEQQMGAQVDSAVIQQLRAFYGVDKSPVEQYFIWIRNMVMHGDFGRSMEWKQPVATLIASRIPYTIFLSLITLIFTYAVAIPIGIFSARKQYSIMDYIFSLFGFIGQATPSFFLALVLMYFMNQKFGISAGGILSPEYVNAPMSLRKFGDYLAHLPIPIFVIGWAGMANVIRVMRATLLDESKKLYVVAARARGLKEQKLTYKYPVRVALNPIISSIGSIFPSIISGATVTAIVLDIPTIGSLLYNALLSQDMYLAGACVLILTVMTVIGMFISDILLVIVDPRIRLNE